MMRRQFVKALLAIATVGLAVESAAATDVPWTVLERGASAWTVSSEMRSPQAKLFVSRADITRRAGAYAFCYHGHCSWDRVNFARDDVLFVLVVTRYEYEISSITRVGRTLSVTASRRYPSNNPADHAYATWEFVTVPKSLVGQPRAIRVRVAS